MTYDYEPLLDPFRSPFSDVWKCENEVREKQSGLIFKTGEEQIEFFSWESENKHQLRKKNEQEINALEKNKDYYFGCSYGVYLETGLANFVRTSS